MLETIEHEQRQDTRPFVAPPELTPDERRRSDVAAMKSLLWLHYAKGWSLQDIGRGGIAGVYARQAGINTEDIPLILEHAMTAYPREMILDWMAAQEAIGN